MLINNGTHQRETLTDRPIRLPLRWSLNSAFVLHVLSAVNFRKIYVRNKLLAFLIYSCYMQVMFTGIPKLFRRNIVEEIFNVK